MNVQAAWICLLSRVDSVQEFMQWSRVCRAAASASRVVKYSVAMRFAKLNAQPWGWSYILYPSQLLHGTRGIIDKASGVFRVHRYTFGKHFPGNRQWSVVPYQEPDDLSLEAIKHLRHVSAICAQSAWRKWSSQLSYNQRKTMTVSLKRFNTMKDVQDIIERLKKFRCVKSSKKKTMRTRKCAPGMICSADQLETYAESIGWFDIEPSERSLRKSTPAKKKSSKSPKKSRMYKSVETKRSVATFFWYGVQQQLI